MKQVDQPATAFIWGAVIGTLGGLIGLGGCPFAPGAAGNVATEDVAYMLSHSGVDTGLELDALIGAANWLGGVLGKPMPSMLSRARGFPPATLMMP